MQLEVNIFIRWEVPPSDLYALIGYSVSTRSHSQGEEEKLDMVQTTEAGQVAEAELDINNLFEVIGKGWEGYRP